MIYNLYIFDRHCDCIFYQSWHKQRQSFQSSLSSRDPDLTDKMTLNESQEPLDEEESKLVYGVILSLRNFANKLSPKQPGDGFLSYRTNTYKLHYYETLSGLKFVLMSDPGVDNMREALRQIYGQIYVEFVVKNPLIKVDREFITNEHFRNALNRYIKSLSMFES
ncbi:Trafficking protein particle complex subunit BET5 [Basidiobolus ranarum]|uniref:Trafficking protein particle complex subunit n=1 Tax=Basidiobolus ranarum TaxID=34480 RepID=A0ABR2WQH7_9FUNG